VRKGDADKSSVISIVLKKQYCQKIVVSEKTMLYGRFNFVPNEATITILVCELGGNPNDSKPVAVAALGTS